MIVITSVLTLILLHASLLISDFWKKKVVKNDNRLFWRDLRLLNKAKSKERRPPKAKITMLQCLLTFTNRHIAEMFDLLHCIYQLDLRAVFLIFLRFIFPRNSTSCRESYSFVHCHLFQTQEKEAGEEFQFLVLAVIESLQPRQSWHTF